MVERRLRKASNTNFRLWLPVALYVALIFYLSSFSAVPLPADVSDKTAHGFGYSGLAVLVTRAMVKGLPAPVSGVQAVGAIVVTAMYGVTDEWHQRYVPGRSSDVHDVYADAIGAMIGTSACWAWGLSASRPRTNA